MNDETLLRTVKNSLMIAGHEMGPVGDHWPAIHAVSKGVDEEFDRLHKNEAVIGEMEFHIASALRDVEEMAAGCSDPEGRRQMEELAKQMWDEYYALLEPISEKFRPSVQDVLESENPASRNMRSALKIIRDMGGNV